jgi:hypothetical protein
MAAISDSDKARIVEALEGRGGTLPCPRCASTEFTVADGYLNQTIQEQLRGVVLGGPSIPSALIICVNCGFMSQHALGALGLLPSRESPAKASNE